MLTNHLILALRQMRRDPSTTALHLVGLTLGIAGFLLILQFVFFERSYDRFHDNADRLFRIAVDIERSGRPSMASAAAYAGVGPALKNDFPEVETYARMANGEATVRIRDLRFWETHAWYVDADFFTMFTLPLLAGDARTALVEPGSVVISERIALKYFGRTECVGESLEAENFFGNRLYKITGVAKNLPENTHLTGEVFFAYSTLATRPNFVPDWGWRDFKNYVLLKNEANRASFEQKITATDWIGSKSPGFAERQMHHKILLQPVPGIYLSGLKLEQELKTIGDPSAVRYLLLIAALVLGMAWMNYVNLSTAKAIERAREIGVRRVVGARRDQVVGQFVMHSLLLNGLAFVLALGLAVALQPVFSNLIGKPLGFAFAGNRTWLAAAGGLFGLGLLLSSVYPAWAISGLSPLKFLSGKTRTGGGSVWLRKGLIVFQFGVSIALIAGTAIVWRQLDFMRHKDLGIDIEQTLAMRAPRPTDSVTYSKYLVFKQILLENPAVKAVTASSNVPGDEDTWNNGVRRYNAANPADQMGITAHLNALEPDFIETYGLQMRAGRQFDPARSTDRRALVITETTAKRFGYPNPEAALNERFRMRGDTFTVVGVAADYHQYGLQRAPEPYIFFQDPTELRRYSVKMSGQNLPETAAFVEKTWKEIFPTGVYESHFLDVHFDQQYRAEVRTGLLFSVFSALAIFIACLGLFGLAAFMAVQRTKEIGIRKVLGASVAGITGLLAKDFLKLVIASFVIASPIAWWAMNQWLQDFAYRIDIQWWMFAAAGAAAVAIAFLAVSFQSVRAALANPVKSLRSE